jgi:hypothetical protein
MNRLVISSLDIIPADKSVDVCSGCVMVILLLLLLASSRLLYRTVPTCLHITYNLASENKTPLKNSNVAFL